MKTLVYFASGFYGPEYQELDYDRIILVDNCFKNKRWYPESIFTKGKVTCLGMDCLESIPYLKNENVTIDCFVCINEGLREGGGRYPINSDFFLGYVMPLLRDTYIHIMNPGYYRVYGPGGLHVTMDLPYEMTEISENEKDYINPFTFSHWNFRNRLPKVFRMTRISNTQSYAFNDRLKFSIHHDSIWNHYDTLDLLAISITDQGQADYFLPFPKTLAIRNDCIDSRSWNYSPRSRRSYLSSDSLPTIHSVFEYCTRDRIEKVGITPWALGDYHSFIEQLVRFKEDYPKEIHLFHLNKDDYKQIKEYAAENL